jgi:cytochrome c-type biogenesis protein
MVACQRSGARLAVCPLAVEGFEVHATRGTHGRVGTRRGCWEPMSVTSMISSGPLLLAMPVAAAAGAVTFLSPCCLPLVPGYLAFITGMSGAGSGTGLGSPVASGTAGMPAAVTDGSGAVAVVPALSAVVPAAAPRSRMLAGAALFVVGFSLVFALLGLAAGGVGELLKSYSALITQVLGGVTVVLGLLFFGAFDKFMFAGRVIKPSVMPKAGLAGAPLLGILFGIGWTPCIGPTLTAVETLSFSTGTAARGAFLAFTYGMGLGIPFLVVAVLFRQAAGVLAFFRRHARRVTQVGGLMLVVLGVVEATGGWGAVIVWMHGHWITEYSPGI